MRSVVARLVLALALLVPVGLTVTAAPAVAEEGAIYCYEFDNQVWEHTEWFGNWGWRTVTYHHYVECTDWSWYWSSFRYEWSRSYWVQVF